MSSSLNRRHLDAGDQHAIVLALDWPRPILVAPNEKDRDFDAPIVLGRGLPALGISERGNGPERFPTRYISFRSAGGMLFASATPLRSTAFMMSEFLSRITVSPTTRTSEA